MFIYEISFHHCDGGCITLWPQGMCRVFVSRINNCNLSFVLWKYVHCLMFNSSSTGIDQNVLRWFVYAGLQHFTLHIGRFALNMAEIYRFHLFAYLVGYRGAFLFLKNNL